MKIGFILTAYDRIDDLLVHLEILKFFPFPYTVIPIWMRKDVPEHFVEALKEYPHSHYVDGLKFRIGPLMALLSGLKKAEEIGLDYVVYRNGDDWLFNHDFCLKNFIMLDVQKKDVGGYNWLTCNTFQEFAMNELYLRVSKFVPHIEEAKKYFIESDDRHLCEFKLGKWLRSVLGKGFEKFYRLPDREFDPGVGYEPDTMCTVFRSMNIKIPDGFWEMLEDNNRFFSKKWQMIGSHNNYQRYRYYSLLRQHIPYSNALEKLPNFKRWTDNSMNGKEWNLPITERQHHDAWRASPVLFLNTLPKKLPKRLIPKSH
jgi:hypothetical protein